MPEESNGHESPSRLDRIERAVEALIDDHERLRASQKELLRAQVILVDNVDKLVKKVDDHEDRIQALVDGQLRLDEAMTKSEERWQESQKQFQESQKQFQESQKQFQEGRKQFEDFVQWARRILDRPSPAT